MNRKLILLSALAVLGTATVAQDIKTKDVPAVVKDALMKKYPGGY